MATTLPLWLLRQPDQAQLLRTLAPSVELTDISRAWFQDMIDDMVQTMYAAEGIGLAAPQIGQSLRVAVIAREVDQRDECLVMINPRLSTWSAELERLEEGCLSIPGVYGPVARPTAVTLSALDRHGQPFRLKAKELLARVIQHEVDHLDGRLFIDRAEKITRGRNLL